MRVNVHGAFGALSGYGKLTWNLSRALERAGVEVCAVPFYSATRIEGNAEPQLMRTCLERQADPQDTTLIVGVPGESRFWGRGHTVGVTMIECSPTPPAFAAGLDRLDEVWTFSEFNARDFAASGSWQFGLPGLRQIEVMPVPLDTEAYHPDVEPMKLPWARKINLGCVFEWSPRKWPIWIEHALDELAERDDVMIHARIYGNERDIGQGLSLMRKRAGGKCGLRWISERIPEERMPSFYRALDAVVGLGAEGIGLPAMEAIACGCRFIGLGWGAGQEVLRHSDGCWWVSGGDMHDAAVAGKVYVGGRWPEPEWGVFRAIIAEFVLQALARVREGFAFAGLDEVGRCYAAALGTKTKGAKATCPTRILN